MKILAVRGENLASLTAPFEIDFTHGQLADSGLFAITGNTGAGKSTLLDAICLALFDQMARFPANRKNQAEIGRSDDPDRLKANDVRHILSRGKAGGYAEVDFLGVDGHSYRARWSVRRARNRVDGRFQKQERQLQALTDNRMHSGNKRDVQELIDSLLGLSWEQFRRAVILPQGEFAAFLKASMDERSALLERMTGTELYSELSMAAFQRARAENGRLESLNAQLDGLVLLTPEAEAELLARLESTEQELLVLKARELDLRDWQQLWDRAGELARQVEDGEQVLVELTSQWQEAAGTREQLAQIAEVEEARSELDALMRTQLELLQLAVQIPEQAARLTQVDGESEQARFEHQAKVTELEQLEAEHRLVQEELKRARELDSVLTGLRLQHQELCQQQAGLHEECERHERRLQEERHQQQLRQQQLGQRQHWLEQHGELACLAPQWQPLQERLHQLLKERQRGITLDQERRQLESAIRQRADNIANLQAAQAVEEQAISQQQTELRQLEQYLASDQLDSTQRHLQQARDRSERLERLQALAEQAVALGRRQQDGADTQRHLAARHRQLGERVAGLEPELAALQEQIRLNRLQLEQIQLRQSLEELRHQLVAGEACPLCGAVDHPYAHQLPDGEGLWQRLMAQQHYLQGREQEWQAALLQYRLELAQVAATLVEQQRQVSSDEAQYLHLAHQWRTICQSSAEALPAWPEEADGWFELGGRLGLELHQAREQVRQLTHQWEQQLARWQQQQQLQKRLEQRQARQQQLERQLQLEWRQQEQQQANLGSCDLRRSQLTERVQEWEASIDTLLVDIPWRERLYQAEGERWLAQLIAACRDYLTVQQEWQQLERELQAQAPALAALASRLDGLREHWTMGNSRLQALARELHSVSELRGQCLDGRPAEQVEQEWLARLHLGREGVATSQSSCSRLGERRASLQALVSELQQRRQQQQRQRRQVLRRWLRLQQKLGVNDYELHRRLAFGSDWIQQEQSRLQQLDARLDAAKIRLAERHAQQIQLADQQQQLLSSCPEAEDWKEETLPQLHQALSEALADTEQRRFEWRQRLHQANEIRGQRDSLMAAYQCQQRETERWLQLNELIGSANGAKFRTFAQSLTLERLLLVANDHLNELAPRYQLQRVPGTDLALQVIDRDMGDEVRAVESLSGGESFLASLSLALGLSSLSARHTRLGSLFIDEGFGTLDPDSLDMALACLDSLQASGRQIGVISHVPTLVERIGVQIRVEALGGGESRIRLPG